MMSMFPTLPGWWRTTDLMRHKKFELSRSPSVRKRQLAVFLSVALSKAGRQTEAVRLLEQLAENAINENR